MLVIFPFEAAIYEQAGVPVEFVGHPLVDLARATRPRADVAARGRDSIRGRPVLALLPGSRPNELRLVLPVLAAAAPLIGARVPGVQFLVARAPSLDDALFAPLAADARRRDCRWPSSVERDRRRAGRGRRRRHGVGHGDRADGAARHGRWSSSTGCRR